MVTEQQATDTAAATRPNAHPLDPLTSDEITSATALLNSSQDSELLRFVTVSLREPEKPVVAAFRPGDAMVRRAFAVVIDRADGTVYEGVGNLNDSTIESWTAIPGVQPQFTLGEFADADRVIREDARWQAALRRRGITDFSLVQIDPWPAGNFGAPEEQGRRLLRGISYVRDEQSSNGYARPIEGVVAVIDLNAKEVIELVDEGDAPVPAADIRYDAESQPSLRDDLKPIEITQPEGTSFTLDGHELRWQKWRMRVSLHPREGLVIHDVAYRDGDEYRSVCYRMSLSEMVVPYGDRSAGQYFKNAFDSGEVGLGRFTNLLTLGCDCLGEITYLDGVIATDRGTPHTLSNAICIHEEDMNILWKHVDGKNEGRAELRRARRLVVSSWATVGNYDYGFYWYFNQDGSIEHEIKLTGIIQTKAYGEDEELFTATRVAENLAGTIHQHFFNVRMDMDVDGTDNTVFEVDTEPLPPGPENPYDNAFRHVLTPIESEADSGREAHSQSARHWRIASATKKNAVGEPTAYALYPGETCNLMAGEASSVFKRAEFAQKQLWVTQHSPDELYVAGPYPAQTTGGDGIPAFRANDRDLDGKDVVLWYTAGVNHIVRPEDFPVSPVHRVGFMLKPWGFFDANPALDVAPPDEHCGD